MSAAGRLRLFCFPFAGGGASIFQSWEPALPPAVELAPVQLPGRESRVADPPVDDLRSLVGQVAAGIADLLQPPYALFGHSMGALLAYELARHLHELAEPPARLFVSGYPAPHLPYADDGMSHLSDDDLLVELRRDATSTEPLAEPELWSLLAPTVRADFRLCETYVHESSLPLACDIVAFAGAQDPHATVDDVGGWEAHTRGRFSLHVVPGGHFFIEESRTQVVAAVGRSCEELVQAQGSART